MNYCNCYGVCNVQIVNGLLRRFFLIDFWNYGVRDGRTIYWELVWHRSDWLSRGLGNFGGFWLCGSNAWLTSTNRAG